MKPYLLLFAIICWLIQPFIATAPQYEWVETQVLADIIEPEERTTDVGYRLVTKLVGTKEEALNWGRKSVFIKKLN